MKGLPIGMQYFKEIIENNYIYVDKTEYIYKIVSTGKYYFLSRPRRFGKSLLVNTLEELFKGNKKLFEGLYIYDKWDWDDKYPVIHLDFGSINHQTPEKLELSLEDFVRNTAKKYNISLYSRFLPTIFEELIEKIHDKLDRQVVVLIDEYDKAIIKHLDDIELAEANRDVLSSFYQVLKTGDRHLRFVFLTGVSKFSKASIFSELNNLTDLTLIAKFSKICGYTQRELEYYFNDYLNDFIQDKNVLMDDLLSMIKKWYNGYSWDGENFLYNPYSILNFFNNEEFNNYWFDTGSPTFLVDMIMNNLNNVAMFLNPETRIAGSFPSFNLKKMHLSTVLLQTGYLTIKEKKIELGKLPEYNLTIPNKEVHDSFYSHLLSYFTNLSAESITPMTEDMLKAIISGDNEKLTRSFEILLNNIPKVLHAKIEDINEAYYHLLFGSWLQILGFDISYEDRTLAGDSDAVLRLDDLVVIIEFKYSKTSSIELMIEKGLDQIKNKGYYKTYQNKPLIFVSIATKPYEVACKIEKFNN